MNATLRICVPALTLAIAAACSGSVNAPIVVPSGETRTGNLNSVNGSVTLEDDATVEGDCRSVNGSIRIGDRARIDGISAVNGSVRVGSDARIDGDIDSVNGSIRVGSGSTIGEIQSVNGAVELSGVEVARSIRSVNGDVGLRDGTIVRGDVVVGATSVGSRNRPLEIELAGGSVIEGDLVNENPALDARVVLRDGSEVRGRIDGVEVVEATAAPAHPDE